MPSARGNAWVVEAVEQQFLRLVFGQQEQRSRKKKGGGGAGVDYEWCFGLDGLDG